METTYIILFYSIHVAAGQEAAIPSDVDSMSMWDTISSKRKSPREEIILNLGKWATISSKRKSPIEAIMLNLGKWDTISK